MTKTIRFPKVRRPKAAVTPLPSPDYTNRKPLLDAIATMPDEAFGWIVVAVATRIFPDGLGGFMPESRTSIEAARSTARKWAGL